MIVWRLRAYGAVLVDGAEERRDGGDLHAVQLALRAHRLPQHLHAVGHQRLGALGLGHSAVGERDAAQRERTSASGGVLTFCSAVGSARLAASSSSCLARSRSCFWMIDSSGSASCSDILSSTCLQSRVMKLS